MSLFSGKVPEPVEEALRCDLVAVLEGVQRAETWKVGGNSVFAVRVFSILFADDCIHAGGSDIDCRLRRTCDNAERGRGYRYGCPGNGDGSASVKGEDHEGGGNDSERVERGHGEPIPAREAMHHAMELEAGVDGLSACRWHFVLNLPAIHRLPVGQTCEDSNGSFPIWRTGTRAIAIVVTSKFQRQIIALCSFRVNPETHNAGTGQSPAKKTWRY